MRLKTYLYHSRTYLPTQGSTAQVQDLLRSRLLHLRKLPPAVQRTVENGVTTPDPFPLPASTTALTHLPSPPSPVKWLLVQRTLFSIRLGTQESEQEVCPLPLLPFPTKAKREDTQALGKKPSCLSLTTLLPWLPPKPRLLYKKTATHRMPPLRRKETPESGHHSQGHQREPSPVDQGCACFPLPLATTASCSSPVPCSLYYNFSPSLSCCFVLCWWGSNPVPHKHQTYNSS